MRLILFIWLFWLVLIGNAFIFSSNDGQILVQRLISEAIPGFEAHNYQLEGVCKIHDGTDLIAVTPTGSGKKGFLFLTMIVVLAISKRPTLVPRDVRNKVPVDPAMVIVAPTISIELQKIQRKISSSFSVLDFVVFARFEAVVEGVCLEGVTLEHRGATVGRFRFL